MLAAGDEHDRPGVSKSHGKLSVVSPIEMCRPLRSTSGWSIGPMRLKIASSAAKVAITSAMPSQGSLMSVEALRVHRYRLRTTSQAPCNFRARFALA